MLNTFRRRLGLPALLLSVALVAAACGGNGDTTNSGPSGLSGDIKVSGSSTVEPISSLVAEKFAANNPDVSISVDKPGTGDGFKLFCNGETDISNASRFIKPEEIAACEEKGIEFVELQIGIDGLSVLTSGKNDAVQCLSFGDLYALTGPESEGFKKWSDANSLATDPKVGGKGDLPDAELSIFGPGEESGTYDSFVELVLTDIAEERGIAEDAIATRKDYSSSPDDNVIIDGIANNDTSLGWVGFAFAENAGDTVKELEVDGGDGCVEPSAETIADGTYPISRPLFIYVNKAKAEENAALAGFVDFYLGEDGLGSVEEVKYVGLTDETKTGTKSVWDARTVGTQEK